MRTSTNNTVSRVKSAVVFYLIAMVAIHLYLFWITRDMVRRGYSDFAIYYCAGTIVREGLGHSLYDDVTQFRVQEQFAPDVPIRHGALPYTHPPFEALFFAPFTYVSYPKAFVLWDLFNVGMLVLSVFLLRPHLAAFQRHSAVLSILASFAFFPVFFALLQGQDAILLLFLYTLSFLSLKKDRPAVAGAWLALGLYKFHLVLPFIVLLLAQKRTKVLRGFLPVAFLLAVISVLLVGPSQIMLYPHYVLNLENTMARGAIVPSDMPNLRGVIYLLLGGSAFTDAIVLVASFVLLLAVAWYSRVAADPDSLDGGFALSLVTTVLVSYHAMGYDLSMLLLAAFLLGNCWLTAPALPRWPQKCMAFAVGLLFFSPLESVLLIKYNRLGLTGWFVLLWLVGIMGYLSSQFHPSSSLSSRSA